MQKNTIIGCMIFADLLEMPLGEYYKFINQLETNPIIRNWIKQGLIQRKNLACFLHNSSYHPSQKSIITILQPITGNQFQSNGRGKQPETSFRYSHAFFQYYYDIDKSLWLNYDDDSSKKSLLHKLSRVNSRNTLTHCLIQILTKIQGLFFRTGLFPLLQPLKITDLTQIMKECKYIQKFFNFKKICRTWLYRIIPNLFFNFNSNSELNLTILIPSNRTKIKRAINDLFKEENDFMINGKIQHPYSDTEIRELLTQKFGIITSIRNVNVIRKILGISPANIRYNNFQYLFETPFLQEFPLKLNEIISNVPQQSGVYEVRYRNKLIEYPKGKSPVFYLGRSQNLKKRLTEHLRFKTKKTAIYNYLKNEPCNFRFYQLDIEYILEEKRLYDLFIKTFGTPPIANKISP